MLVHVFCCVLIKNLMFWEFGWTLNNWLSEMTYTRKQTNKWLALLCCGWDLIIKHVYVLKSCKKKHFKRVLSFHPLFIFLYWEINGTRSIQLISLCLSPLLSLSLSLSLSTLVQQRAHGPLRSTEKPVQINKHICSKPWLFNIHLERKINHLLFYY